LAGVEFWDDQAGDTFLLIGHRQFLGDHFVALSSAQKQLVQDADQKVLNLINTAVEETEDVDDLRRIARIFKN